MEKEAVSPLDAEDAFDSLVAGDVLTEREGEIRFSDSFSSSIQGILDDIARSKPAVRSYLEGLIEDDDLVRAAEKITDGDAAPVAGFLALRRHLGDISEANCAQLVPVLDQLLRGPPRSSGAPEGFLPTRGDLLPFLIPILQLGIVYFWRDDCDPCDLVKNDFEAHFDETPTDMGLLAVYGTDWVDEIHEFQVGAAPTILFIRDGRVDTRLVGAFPPSALEREIEKLRELASSV